MSNEYNPKSNVVFGNVDLSDYNAYAVYCNIFDRPERDVSVVAVPGRNGDLIFDNGRYKNVDRTYQIHVVGVENVHNLIRDLTSTIGYQRLEDEYDPNVYMMARLKSKPNVRKFVGNAVLITVTFDRMPQKWDKNSESISTPAERYGIKYRGQTESIYARDALHMEVTNDSNETAKPMLDMHIYYNIGLYSDATTKLDIFVSDTAVRTGTDNYMNYNDFYSDQGGNPIYELMMRIELGADYIHGARIYNISVDSENKIVYDSDTNEVMNKYITELVSFPDFTTGTKHVYIVVQDYTGYGDRTTIDVNVRKWTL